MMQKLSKYLKPKPGQNSRFTLKNWVAYVLFGAIIIVFGLWGVKSDQYGESSGGVAAVVNESTISLAEYRNRVENAEQNARQRFEQLPEVQKRSLMTEVRKRTLEELIQGELLFQAAARRGIIAADGEVRDYILQIPFLNENGRFLRERYRAFLQNTGLTTVDFERQVRKQIVTQKLQDLFVGSATPSREEARRARLLSEQKVNLRFAQLQKEDLAKLVSASDIQSYQASNKAEIEKYYNENKIEFTQPEKLKARHILIRSGDARTEPEAEKIAKDLSGQLTVANFAAMASKNSDDPGSKAKGGELPEFERGRMVPEFEEAAAALKDGEISKPVKSAFGYHLILLEKKTPAGLQPLDTVQADIARKLLLRGKEQDIVAQLRKPVEAGSKAEVDAQLKKAGIAWQESGEFELSTPSIPKLGENAEVLAAVMKRNRSTGLIPQLINSKDGYVIAEIQSWKTAPPAAATSDDTSDRMLAFRRSSEVIESWAKDVESKASIQRNPRL